jgi:hypothetical protein
MLELKYTFLRKILCGPPLTTSADLLSPHLSEFVERLFHPRRLVVMDDGRIGRLNRPTDTPDPGAASEFELEGEDGATSSFSPRDLRYIFTADCEDSRSAA